MPIVLNPESEYAKELQKWDAPKREGGMNANGYEPFPKMLYRAFPNDKGKVLCGDNPLRYSIEADALAAEAFTRRCQLTVQSPDERDRALQQGWYLSPGDALAGYEKEQQAIADAAGKRHYQDAKMGARAQAEAHAADAATHEHVAEVPAPKKRGRTKRLATV